jgi:hypothetical protein
MLKQVEIQQNIQFYWTNKNLDVPITGKCSLTLINFDKANHSNGGLRHELSWFARTLWSYFNPT